MHPPQGVDSGDTYIYIGTTYLARFWLEISGRFRLAGLVRLYDSVFLSGSVGPRAIGSAYFLYLRRPVSRRLRASCASFLDRRDRNMTQPDNHCRKILLRDTRIPSEPACFLLPRRNNKPKHKSRVRPWERTSHGVARATKNLRGMRLPLVPRPESWMCLLSAL
jgi:hypothetical protein